MEVVLLLKMVVGLGLETERMIVVGGGSQGDGGDGGGGIIKWW